MQNNYSLPCYIRNGGKMGVKNIPLGFWQRLALRGLLRELLESHRKLGNILACHATQEKIYLLDGLLTALEFDYKPRANRREAENLLTVQEKNLKSAMTKAKKLAPFNMVELSAACGLVGFVIILFCLSAVIS